MARSAEVGRLRAAGQSLPDEAAESLSLLQRALEAFAKGVSAAPLLPATAAKVAGFFASLGEGSRR